MSEIEFGNPIHVDYGKKYKEALERAKKLRDNANGLVLQKWCENVFPELAEPEDEKIKKKLLELFNDMEWDDSILHDYNLDKNKTIAWLEKQGEKFIPEDINEAALQYVDTCAVDGEITHDNVTEPYWNNHSMMSAYKAGWLEKQGKHKDYYTKQELIDMGFSFTLNGDIVTPDEMMEDMKKYLAWKEKQGNKPKKVEDEEYNSEDYGIDGIWHAKNILEKTLGTVDGYQTDDGILSHKCAISAVKKLYEKKSAKWSEDDEELYQDALDAFEALGNDLDPLEDWGRLYDWLKSIKQRMEE